MVPLSHWYKGTNRNSTVQETSQQVTVAQTDAHAVRAGTEQCIYRCPRTCGQVKRKIAQTVSVKSTEGLRSFPEMVNCILPDYRPFCLLAS